MSLIAALNDLQHEHGWLPPETLNELSARRGVALYEIQAVASFYPHFHTEKPPARDVAVCRDVACHIRGGEALHDSLRRALADDDVSVRPVSCLGRCDLPPAVCVDDVPLDGSDADRIARIAKGDEALVEAEPRPRRRWPMEAYDDGAAPYATLARVRGGALTETPALLKEAGLRGLGGAAFPAGLKWELVAKEPGPEKFVVCNADESEPGTFKDRVVLAELPHLVVEGIAIAAHVVGAKRAWVFIRHEYEPERRALAAEIERARDIGVLNDGFDLEIFVSPGGYILGEETALLECMEDKRGEPRNKPPFPGQKGLWGKPTLINNVETFAAATAILARGVDWWNDAGVRECKGFKFLSVCGDVERPDVYQVPMGTTVAELIELAGGMKNGAPLKAFSPGGASSDFLPASSADAQLDFERMKDAGSMLGSGALFVVSEGRDMVELGTNIVRFFRNESCGKCVPCRVGSEKAVGMLESIQRDGGRRDQLALLNELADTMAQTSICGLGQVAINPILSVIRHFEDDVTAHVKD